MHTRIERMEERGREDMRGEGRRWRWMRGRLEREE
jgi:hypothetical protein